MRRRQFLHLTTTTIALSLLNSHFSLHASRPPRKTALLVGINTYPKNNQNVDPLKGCENDVALMKNLLQYRYGFNDRDITTLIDTQATRETILTKFHKLITEAEPNDVLVFAFSGHGALLTDFHPIDRKNPITTGLVPYDCEYDSRTGDCNYITGTTLFLLRSLCKTPNLTVILDCCYAGGGNRGDSTGRSVPLPLTSRPFRPNAQELNYQTELRKTLTWDFPTLQSNRQNNIGPQGVLLAAATADQIARDSVFSNHYNAGAFTKLFTEILWEKDLPLAEVETRVTQSLRTYSQDPTSAQSPNFFFHPPAIPQKEPFFIPKQSPIPAQGSIIDIDRKTRMLTLWLGGLPYRALNASTGTEFRLLNASGRPTETRITLTGPIDPDFTATALLPNNAPIPPLGTLIQQFYRPIPKDFKLKVGFEANPEPITFSSPERIQLVPVQPDGRFGGVDLIFGKQMDSNDSSDRYGLFTPDRTPMIQTFGPPNETILEAVDRLQPQFKIALIKKLLSTLSATPQEIANTPQFTASIVRTDRPGDMLSLPNQIKQSVKPHEKITIQVNNRTNENLEMCLIGIPPNGKITYAFFSGESSFSIAPEDGVGLGELIVLASQAPLTPFMAYLTELTEEMTERTSPQKNRSQNRSQQSTTIEKAFLKPLASISQSRSQVDLNNPPIETFVISLPLQITTP